MQDKIFTDTEKLSMLLDTLRDAGKSITWTNGCFDILHAGHVTYLEEASHLGDILVVGINSDASVRAVKGPDRPINTEDDRALILAALASTDYILIFGESNTVPLLEALRPDVYAKGGDYTLDTINQEERQLVESYGGEIKLLSGVEGRSTTQLIDRVSKEASG